MLEQMRDQTIPIEINSRLREDLGLTSMQLIGLITSVESAFGINLETEDFKESNFISLHTVVKMLEANYAV